MGYFDKYKPYIWDNFKDTEKRKEDGTTEIIINENKKDISSKIYMHLVTELKEATDIYLCGFSEKDLGFVAELLKLTGNLSEFTGNSQDFFKLENIIAVYACRGYWKYILDNYNIPQKLIGKNFEKEYTIFEENENDSILGIKDKLSSLQNDNILIKILFTNNLQVSEGEDYNFIAEFDKLKRLEEVIKSLNFSILSDITKGSINDIVKNNLIPYLQNILKFCFEDIATYIITPMGIYGDLNKYNTSVNIPKIDYLPYDSSNRATIKSLTKFSRLYWNMALGGNITNVKTESNETAFSDEFRDKNGSKYDSEKLSFPFDINNFFEYFMFPYMSYMLINKNSFKIEEINDGSPIKKYKIVYDNLKFENEKDFYSHLGMSYIDLVSILITDFITTDSDLENYRLTEDEKKTRITLKELEKQDSKKGIDLIDKVLNSIVQRFKMIMYSLSDLEKGSNLYNIDIIASLFSGVSKTDSLYSTRNKGGNLSKGFFIGTDGLASTDGGSFSDIKCLAENCIKGKGFSYFRGIYTLDAKREANELLFAYKKYDSLFYNNKPLGANFILGRDEETRMPVILPLNVPQNIITTIIAGSGAGKGVLTLAALANLFVGGHSVIYADFKPDMGATLWEMSKNAEIPIYSIDGKDLTTSAGIMPYGGSNNEYGITYKRDDGSLIPLEGKDWHGYDSHIYNFVQHYLGNDGVKIIPYLKTMQLFVALGLARKSAKSKLKSLKKLDGSPISDNGKKMFLILDEAQLANTIYDGLITDLDKAIKEKPSDIKDLERFKYVFVDKLAKEMKDVVITTGRVSKMGIILIGQQVDPSQWSTPQGSWKECTFGYMVGNAAIKLVGNNCGTSPAYGMPAKFAESKDSEVGKTLGYWAYSTQVKSGKDEKAKGLKTYLILNKNDYQVNVDYDNQNGEFTGGLFTSRPDEEAKEQLAADLTIDDAKQHIRENVGFDGMLKQFLNTGRPLDANGYSDEYKEKVSYTYYLYESFLIEAGIVGPDKAYPNLFSYLYSVNPDSFYTAGELYESFKQGKANKSDDTVDTVNVFEFLTTFAAFEDKQNQGIIYNENDEVIGLKMNYSTLQEYADDKSGRLHKYYESIINEINDSIKELNKEIEEISKKDSLTKEEEHALEEKKKSLSRAQSNIEISHIQEGKDLLIFKEILKQTSKEKFEKYPIDPEYVKNPNISVSLKESGKPAFSVSYGHIENYVNSLFKDDETLFYSPKGNPKCLELKLRGLSNAFKKDESTALTNFNMGKSDISLVVNKIAETGAKNIDTFDASPEDKKKGLDYLEEKRKEYIKYFENLLIIAYKNKVPIIIENRDENENKSKVNTENSVSGTGALEDGNDSNPLRAGISQDTEEDEDNPLDGRISDILEKYRKNYKTNLTEANNDIIDLAHIDKVEKNRNKFEKDKAKSLFKYEAKFAKDKLEFLEKMKSEITVLELRDKIVPIIDKEYTEDLEELKQNLESMSFECGSQETGSNGGKPDVPAVKKDGKRHVSEINGQSITSQIDTGDMQFNISNIDEIGNVKASKQLTQMVIKDIKHQFGGINNIDEIIINAEGRLIINGYCYSPKFSDSLMESLGLAIKQDLESGKIGRIVNLGNVLANIMNNIYSLEVDDLKILKSSVFQNELGIRNEDYGKLFKKYRNLQVIYLPYAELTRENPNSKNTMGIGGKLANLFGFGKGDRNSNNYIPNASPTNNENSLVDNIFQSRPVKVLTRAFGWTMGCKAVVVAATLFGPWGLLFGALAAAGAYGEIKESRANSAYKSTKRNSGGNSKSKKPKNEDDDE